MRIDRLLRHLFCGLAALSCSVAVPLAHATDRESMEQLRTTTLNLIQLLVQEGVLSKEKAETLIKQAEAAKQPAQTGKGEPAQDDAANDDEKVMRVQYVPEFVKDQMREEIKKDVMAKAQSEGWAYPGSIPEWLNRIELEGDLRLRYERDIFPAGNEAPVNLKLIGIDTLDNTSQDRDRWRIRARLGAKLKISDAISGGIRLTTGSSGDPVSPNQTMGDSSSSSSKYNFALDRAYLKYEPTSWLSLSGGRMENPWFNTDLVWDPDLAFDGGVVALKPKFGDNLTGFATVGAFPMQEVQTTKDLPGVAAKDKWLYGAQAGFEWMSSNKSSFKAGVAYYNFTNVQGIGNELGLHTYDKTARQFHQKGNTVFDINNPQAFGSELWGLASAFREVNLTGALDIATFSPVHVVLTGDYVKNVGFNKIDVTAKAAGNSAVGGDTGYMAKLLVGMPETLRKNDWNVFGAYKHLEANAVMDAYTDSDFHLGGTNTKGWIIGANYGLDKNTWVTARWFSADEIATLPGFLPLSIDVLMIDLNAKF